MLVSPVTVIHSMLQRVPFTQILSYFYQWKLYLSYHKNIQNIKFFAKIKEKSAWSQPLGFHLIVSTQYILQNFSIDTLQL